VKEGDTPLHIAARLDDPEKVNAAVAAMKSAEAKEETQAAKARPTDKPHRSVGIDAQNEEGATALHIAAASGSLKALKALLSHGANLNAKDDAGSTPLHQAVAATKTDCVNALIDAKADMEATDDTLATPLNLAASCDYASLVQVRHSLTPQNPL